MPVVTTPADACTKFLEPVSCKIARVNILEKFYIGLEREVNVNTTESPTIAGKVTAFPIASSQKIILTMADKENFFSIFSLLKLIVKSNDIKCYE